MMNNLSKKLQYPFCCLDPNTNSFNFLLVPLTRFLFFNSHPFFIQLCCFVILSLFGYLGLKVSKPRTPVRPSDLDLFYTSVSASTVSSMAAVEMEVFSNSQLILLTFLMFVGGEIFTSMLDLVFARYKYKLTQSVENTSSVSPTNTTEPPANSPNQIELVSSSIPHSQSQNHQQNDSEINVPNGTVDRLKYKSLRYLIFVVLGYLIVSHVVGFSLVCLYIAIIPSATQVLRNKGIKTVTFSLFTIVSTFANCGFVPTNENMIVFNKNSGLLLLLLPHIFLGNTLYPPCLRLVIMLLKRVTRREEFSYLLKNSKDIGYDHFLSPLHCCLLVATVFGFNMIQFVMFCSMEWNSKNMGGLNLYQKLIASLFQVANTRHAGENVFDLSTVSSAILVLFVLMMYLPAYTTFSPTTNPENKANSERKSLVEWLVFSQLTYLVIFIIAICITESKSLREDPLNFSVLNITFEVISAYGNVGLTTGYSCGRQLKAEGRCKDSWVGLSGKWSTKGKLILILVMLLGRLKKFNIKGGKAWHTSPNLQ